MTEVQGILNSRPLTPVSSDQNDLEPPKPNHLLLLRANPNLLVGIFSKEDVYSKRRWRQVQYMSDIFGGAGLRSICQPFKREQSGQSLVVV